MNPGRPGASRETFHAGATPSRTFVGHPTPVGGHEIHAANGSVVRTRANGTRSDIHDVRRGIEIHHGLDGNRHIVVERADHSRIFVERGGRGYVQHPYMYRGHEFGQRTYFVNGRAYDRFYRRYPYHGVFLEIYAPARFYPLGFYGWAYDPWVRPVSYAWGWRGNPWYGYYGYYFAPYPVYASASFWLTDYLIANSLQAAYLTQMANADAAAAESQAANAQPVLSPEVKDLIADEVTRQVALANVEARANAQHQEGDPASGGVVNLLSDNRPHVFVAGKDLDLVNVAGQECSISQGDVVQVMAAPAPDEVAINAVVLSSKGGNECASSDNVSIALSDLQDMQNHMRETIDQGMAELQAKQGQGGLPAAPAAARGAPIQAAFAAGAPPPDANARSEINQQTQQADQAEREDAGSAAASSDSAPPTISLGQSIDDVTNALGNPSRIVNLGAKKIYVYPDMKIIFQNGQVSDVQ